MKVLFVSSGNSHYGIVPFIKSQGESLKKEGVDIDYFTIKGKGFKGYLKNIRPLRKHIKKNNYDLIHAHYGLVGLVCVLTFSGLPIVLSVMGDDAYGSFNAKGKRILTSYFNMFLTQIALVFADQIIVKSKNILKVIPYKLKSQIVPNGVDFGIFKPVNSTLLKDSILFLANPEDPRKNFNLVKKAVEILDNRNINLVNPYPIKHDDFPKFLNKSSVFVLTSYNEGSPNVIKEAMACNIPIVSTDVGDVKWVLEGTEGCYLTSFEAKDVANKIEKAIKFSKENGKTKGRERLRYLGLDSKSTAEKIIKIYKSILKK